MLAVGRDELRLVKLLPLMLTTSINFELVLSVRSSLASVVK